MIITLCGSTKFKRHFELMDKSLTLEGHVVLTVAFFGHCEREPTEEEKKILDEVHKKKIDVSDAILVINPDRYVGESTKSEIEHAKAQGKIILWLENFVTCMSSRCEEPIRQQFCDKCIGRRNV